MGFWSTKEGQRALSAYFRNGGTEQPDEGASGIETHEKKDYVVLRNLNGILKVYRVRNDGMLKGLRRWPEALGE